MNAKKNTWLNSDGSGQVDFYLSSRDVIVIERNRVIKIILDILQFHYRDVSGLNITDLGCGDGIITKAISKVYPDNNFLLIDGSKDMLDQAKQKLKGKTYTFICQSFEDIIESPAQPPSIDFIVSPLAIHHLSLEQKKSFYKKIYGQLTNNSMILVFDVVKPSSLKSEEIQFGMWKWWMNEKLHLIENGKDVGKYDWLPVNYKKAEENQPSTLLENLDGLSGAGFHDVDCYYKYSIYTLFGGIKKSG